MKNSILVVSLLYRIFLYTFILLFGKLLFGEEMAISQENIFIVSNSIFGVLGMILFLVKVFLERKMNKEKRHIDELIESIGK